MADSRGFWLCQTSLIGYGSPAIPLACDSVAQLFEWIWGRLPEIDTLRLPEINPLLTAQVEW